MLLCLWIVLFLVGLVMASYYRQKQLERQIEENISVLKETVNENSEILERDWEALDKNDPEELSDYFWEEAYGLYSIYFLDFHEYLQREEKLFSGTIWTQARECALLEVKSKILGAYFRVCDKWACSPDAIGISGHAGEYCRILQKYYGGENSSSWDDFIRSDHYEAFLNELFSSIETMEELPLNECYQNTMDHAKKAASRNTYSEVLSESYMFMVETAYENYQVHESQKDFAGAIMDAEVVYALNDTLHVLDRASFSGGILYTGVDTDFVHVHDIISDTFIVFVLSLLALVAVHFVQIMRLERQY
jgi:hypothetical protein